MAGRRGMSDDSERSPDETEAVFGALSNDCRRYVLRCLHTRADPLPLPDLADEVAAWKHDASVADVSAEEVKRIYLSLYHKHVPRLADAGLVQYDQTQDAVALLASAERLEREFGVSITE